MSHRPLDTLAKEKHAADRMRYATRKHHIRPDSIDKLDDSTNSYHHGGPYDATLFARNNTKDSPLQALKGSNAEALKATPHEKIVDSIQGHRPLDGVAAYAPGQMDRNGHVYQYEQGENMMIDLNPGGGAYKRWPGVQYHPDDIKGKGEPSYSIEKALKQSSLDEKAGVDGIEMKSQNRSRSGSGAVPDGLYHDEPSQTVGRSGSFSRGLNQRIGSLKKHRQHKHE
jgi:Pal1 cell morphology protein